MGKKFTGVMALNKSKTAWQYRIKMTLPNGEKIDKISRRNEEGKPYFTAEEAYKAREKHLKSILSKYEEKSERGAIMTLSEVYAKYLSSAEAKSKAPATLKKQQSMWENWISVRFGEKQVNRIKISELFDFLYHLYVVENKAYAYVEGFLKFFYLLFGFAYRCEAIDTERYTRFFIDKKTRLSMPKKLQSKDEDEDAEIAVYTEQQLKDIEELISRKEGNLLPAFYLGLKAGLRISEVFGLRWQNIDFDNHIITVNRQMIYEDYTYKLCPVKTLASVRKVIMPPSLEKYLIDLKSEQEALEEERGKGGYKNNENVLDTITKEYIEGGDFVNRKRNGILLTVNSFKYYSRTIKKELGINFKFHNLRHTYATNCAIHNMNIQVLMNQMGHKKIETTRRYYINLNNKDLQTQTYNLLSSIYPLHF